MGGARRAAEATTGDALLLAGRRRLRGFARLRRRRSVAERVVQSTRPLLRLRRCALRVLTPSLSTRSGLPGLARKKPAGGGGRCGQLSAKKADGCPRVKTASRHVGGMKAVQHALPQDEGTGAPLGALALSRQQGRPHRLGVSAAVPTEGRGVSPHHTVRGVEGHAPPGRPSVLVDHNRPSVRHLGLEACAVGFLTKLRRPTAPGAVLARPHDPIWRCKLS